MSRFGSRIRSTWERLVFSKTAMRALEIVLFFIALASCQDHDLFDSLRRRLPEDVFRSSRNRQCSIRYRFTRLLSSSEPRIPAEVRPSQPAGCPSQLVSERERFWQVPDFFHHRTLGVPHYRPPIGGARQSRKPLNHEFWENETNIQAKSLFSNTSRVSHSDSIL